MTSSSSIWKKDKSRFRKSVVSICLLVILVLSTIQFEQMSPVSPVAAQEEADLYMKDTPLDTGVEPNPDTGPMWVTEDIWVRTTPDPNYRPFPFPESSPSWTPQSHENPEYRDPVYGVPNYVYVRIRNRGESASTGEEQLHLYFTKASTGLAWPTQWVDYVVPTGGTPVLYGMEVTKPRQNAAAASPTERAEYIQAIQDIGGQPGFVFPDGTSYWHQQNDVHVLGSAGRHGTPLFLPWHREMINRYEVLLQQANPTVKLMYWDWTTDPENSTGGFNFFTSSFMGESGRGTGGTLIGAPFLPTLSPPNIIRNLSTNVVPPADSDSSILSSTNGVFQIFAPNLEQSPNHDSSHGYIGGGGNMSFLSTAAQDPFFFLLHTNVDRLWAQWQRQSGQLSRLDPATAFDGNSTNSNITATMGPWNGTNGVSPYTVADGYIVNKTAQDRSVVSPPIYDTAPLVIPALEPGEAVILEIPWFPPNPADFASFGGDQGHFCLLARIITDTSAPFGMSTPEGANVSDNTRNNNNIVWKNVTVVDNFPGAERLASVIIRNPFRESIITGLRFAETDEFGASFFEFGNVMIDLGPELFDRWREAGQAGEGFEQIDETIIQIFSPEAFIANIPLEPEEQYSVNVIFELSQDYEPVRDVVPKWDLIQFGGPDNEDEIIGGQRFQLDISKLILVPEGSEWRYFDDGFQDDWQSLDFEDEGWKLGQADIGFGNNPVTTIDIGEPDRRRITTYFRKTFEVADPELFRSLFIRLKRNDGAVVYLNGEEVHRVNMPEDEISEETVAGYDVEGLERDVFFPVKIDRDLLAEGKNVIAVEIHLASERSTDMTFDLELYGNPADLGHAPVVSFITSELGALYSMNEPLTLQAEAIDPDGEIEAVDFIVDGELVSVERELPFTFQLDRVRPGTHMVEIVATDESGNQTRLNQTFSIVENVPPEVRLLAPQNGTTFNIGSTIEARAEASDFDGEVARVEFYLKTHVLFGPGELVGTDEEAPFTLTLTDLEADEYMLFAVAIDDNEAESMAIPIMFTIRD